MMLKGCFCLVGEGENWRCVWISRLLSNKLHLKKFLTIFRVSRPSGPEVSAQDLTEDEETEAVDEDVVDDVTAEDEDDEAEVEDDENVELVSD